MLNTPIHDTGSMWYLLLSVLLPVLGLIGTLLFKHFRHYRNAKACKKGTIIGFVILAVLIAILLLGYLVVHF